VKKILLVFVLLWSVLNAEVIRKPVSAAFLKQRVPVVDIRTPGEWRQTGLLEGSIPIMFFDERGGYDIPGFLKELNAKVDTSKPFAIICRTGNRTGMLAPFLSKELGYTVIELQGGVVRARQLGLPFVPYR
jgi:rhodanese-related sulfurtransferase